MFINCPFCRALVATDPATDLPPDHCPRCAAKLRGLDAEASGPATSTALQAGEPAPVPRLDPDFLLQVPSPDMSLPEGGSGATPSELSSQIHQIVALEAPGAASDITPAIAPIATMLKRGDEATSPNDADETAGNAGATAREAKPTPPSAGAPVPTLAASPAEPVTTNLAPVAAPVVQALDLPTGHAGRNDAAGPPADVGLAAAQAGPGAPAPAPAATLAADQAGATAVAATVPAAALPGSPSAVRASAPSFMHRQARPGDTGLHWKTLAAIAALSLLLALQLLLADRAQLAADARWRPLVANVCGVLGCALPPWREPAAFTVLAREVRPHPSTPGALRVSATFRNDARWPQPWPRLRLTLSDVDGNAVASRDFSALDYLGAAPAQAELHSGQSASIAMDIVEPETQSVAFDFELH